MAEKRMFTKKITNSDEFISMPHSSQNLYFHLNMEADDDGFVNGVKRIMRTINANEDDLKILIHKRFVLVFENSSIIVIKHWKLHNAIRNDRYKPTDYVTEKALIFEKENGVYTTSQPSDNQVTTNGMHSIRLDLDKVSIDKVRIEKANGKNIPPSLEEIKEYIIEKGYQDYVNAEAFFHFYGSKGWKVGSEPMKNWHNAIGTFYTRHKGEKEKVFKLPYEEYVENEEEKKQRQIMLDRINELDGLATNGK